MFPRISQTWLIASALALIVGSGCEADAGPAPVSANCDLDATAWTVWVTNQGEGFDTVTVLQNHGDGPVEGVVLATIPVGRAPHNIAFSPDGTEAWVANLGTPPEVGSVSVIDVASYTVVATIPAGVKAHGVTLTPDGREVWIANVAGDDVTIIDAATRTVAATIPVGDGPALVAFLPDGSKAYVSNGTAGTTSVVDVASRAVIATIATGEGAMGLVVSPDGRWVFETEGIANRLSAIDTATDTVAQVLTFNGALLEAHGLALGNGTLLVTNRSSDALSFIDLETLELSGSVAVPGRPDLIGVSPNCDRAYMTLRDVPGVAVVDLEDRRYLDLIGLGGGDLHGVAVHETTE